MVAIRERCQSISFPQLSLSRRVSAFASQLDKIKIIAARFFSCWSLLIGKSYVAISPDNVKIIKVRLNKSVIGAFYFFFIYLLMIKISFSLTRTSEYWKIMLIAPYLTSANGLMLANFH